MFEQYEEWLKQQGIFKTLCYQHGNLVLVRENNVYKILAVELGYRAWMANLANRNLFEMLFKLNFKAARSMHNQIVDQKNQIVAGG